MTIASSYAQALFDLVAQDSSKASKYMERLKMSLEKRGHIRLLPAIVNEYQKLELQKERSTRHKNVTPEKDQVRNLLELYKKLTEVN